jgi:hypothetical protein
MHSAHNPHDSPDEKQSASNEAHDGGYELAPETSTPSTSHPRKSSSAQTALRPKSAAASVAPDSESDDEDEESADGNGNDEDGDDEASLLPPISRPANPSPWMFAGGIALAVLLVSWLAGAPQLVLPESSPDGVAIIRELSFFERLEGLARTAVALPLATLGGVFGLLVLAFVRQRPVGDVPALFAKVSAIAAFSMLLWLVPSDIRFLKQCLNVIGVPLVGGALAIPIFGLTPRDAFLAATYTLLGMLLLVFLAATVMWAVAG